MPTSILDADLLDFLPESIRSDPEIIAMSKAVSAELREVAAAVEQANILPRISELPEEVLNVLAWDHRLNRLQLWDSATVAKKREVLQGIFKWRKKSGTPAALKHFLGLLEAVPTLTEWFQEEPRADPYTYRLNFDASESGITLAQLQQIREVVLRFGRAGARMRELAIDLNREAPLRIIPVVTVGRHITIEFGG